MKGSTEYNKDDIFWRDAEKLKDNPYKVGNLESLNCLLLYLTNDQDFSREYYPITLGYAASLLRMNKGKADIRVKNVGEYSSEKFTGYGLVAIYPMVNSINETLEIAGRIKKDNPNTKICLFNSDQHQHEMILCSRKARDYARTLMNREQSLDYILVGEAEYSFINLCRKIAERDENLEGVSACFYRENRVIKESKKPIVPVNFEFLPLSSRDFLEQRISEEGINSSSPRVQSSRGCVSPCLYCAESFLNITENGRKAPIINKDIEKFVDEIELLQKKYGAVFFNIIDSSFEGGGQVGIARMDKFYDEILKRGIEASFKIHLRPETVTKLDDKFILKFKEAGVDILIAGIESTIEEELQSYKRKKVDIPQQIANIKRLDSFEKFFTIIGHMMFSANLTLEDLPKKVEFMKSVNRSWDNILMAGNLLAFRGTAYHEFLRTSGLEKETDELTPIIPYRFKDERIEDISEAMGNIKIKCPSAINLHNLLYDSMNIVSRYHNKMNKNLWESEEIFIKFKKDLDKILSETGEVYAGYLLGLIDLARRGWNSEKADIIYKENIEAFFPQELGKIRKSMGNFFTGYKEKGLSTSKLFLKTWMSIINSQINTSGGKIV